MGLDFGFNPVVCALGLVKRDQLCCVIPCGETGYAVVHAVCGTYAGPRVCVHFVFGMCGCLHPGTPAGLAGWREGLGSLVAGFTPIVCGLASCVEFGCCGWDACGGSIDTEFSLFTCDLAWNLGAAGWTMPVGGTPAEAA